MVEKYIIDKAELHDLLIGKELDLPQGRKARAFCVEIAGDLTNGEAVQAMFPNIDKNFSNVIDLNLWWNAPYKTEK